VAVALVACGKSSPPQPHAARAAAQQAVTVASASVRPMSRTISVTGTLAAQERSMLSAKVPGRLEVLRVDVGSAIRQGDLLAQIERRDYELRLQQAAAALGQARAALGLPAEGEDDRVELSNVASIKQAQAVLEEAAKNRERVLNLSRQGIASASEVDTVEATYRVALARHETALEEARTRIAALAERRAEYDLARKQLADTAVLAPFEGAVQSRRASLGEYLSAGTPILQVVKTTPLRLRLQVPERESARVRAGQEVRLTIDGDTNRYAGEIARLSPALDEQTRMLLVEADVPAQGTLRPGLFVRAEIVVNPDDPGLSIPSQALLVFAGVEKVVTVESGKAVEKPVTTGRRGPGWIEILSGLSPGETVVLNPTGLRTGQPLTVKTAGQSSGSAAATPAS
jgi:RND family efflux transporter MFP subunit